MFGNNAIPSSQPTWSHPTGLEWQEKPLLTDTTYTHQLTREGMCGLKQHFTPLIPSHLCSRCPLV